LLVQQYQTDFVAHLSAGADAGGPDFGRGHWVPDEDLPQAGLHCQSYPRTKGTLGRDWRMGWDKPDKPDISC
jgi:hypothetical protein